MIASATRQCYYPNGLAAADATPCLPNLPDSGEHSPCCRPPGLDSACLAPTAAGLCLNQRATDARAVLYVAGCTDPSMQDDACPSYCKSVELGEASVYAIVPCSDGTWCCSAADGDGIGDTACCSNADQTFRLDWGALLLSAQHHRAAEGHLTAQQLTRRDDTNSSSTSTTSSTTAASSSAIPLALDDDDDDDDDDGKHQCPPDRSYIVGLSAGVPLGVCLLAALAAIFVLLNRDRKARERIRQMTEAAREERERAAQEHMIPRLYNPSTTKSMRFSHGSTVVTAGPPPHTPQQQQQQEYGYQQPYEGYQHPYDGDKRWVESVDNGRGKGTVPLSLVGRAGIWKSIWAGHGWKDVKRRTLNPL
ncbi:FAR-17a/AIG1-like protein [Neofusicoccum parvum]|uniref:FAR-17a/AIG1-like protein n=1 Tax=Neofusicoccum parvum TaxID=310453 RepID=A0ACB5S6D8_9PEZI|nr:FAR-17a/AIG1-like protein [Neofusicoccum parvum]